MTTTTIDTSYANNKKQETLSRRRTLNQQSYRRLKPFKDELKRNKDMIMQTYVIVNEDIGMSLQELINKLIEPFENEYKHKVMSNKDKQ